jgi:hypothetical protein
MPSPPATTHTPQAHGGERGGAPERARWRRLRPPVLLAALVVLASLALHLRDPHEQGSWGFCPWLLLTGTTCPGCGGLRAVNDLTNGRVLEAAASNLLVVGALPVLVALWVRELRVRWRGVRRPWPPGRVNAAWAVALACVLGFWVLRNLPLDAVAWLAP